MAPHFANRIPSRLLMWQRVREYAVPPSMIETATARRAVGDWAGACAAARVDVALDLRAVRDRYGTDLRSHLRTDLRRLAPDLLRWHMPRIAPDGRLRPGLTVSLTRYQLTGGTPLHLVVRTPPAWADAGQRMSLALWEGPGTGGLGYHPHPNPDRRFRLDLHRHLWDAECSGALARRCGAVGAPPDHLRPPSGTDRFDRAADASWAVSRWAAEAEVLLRAEGRPRGPFTLRLGRRGRAVLELLAPDDSHVPTFRPLPQALPPQQVAALPVLPEAAARTLPDLELLRAGLVTAERLHPLVTASLVRGERAPAVRPAAQPAAGHRVECRGEIHRIALRDGVLTAVDHDPDQLRREAMLVALGGSPLPCLRAIDAVHRSPEALPAVRERLRHGDVAGALTVVEGLLGPGAVLRDGPLRQELETAAARRVDHGLFRAGLVTTHHAPGTPDRGTPDPGRTPRARHATADHRPRFDRHTAAPERRKRARPRTALYR